MEKEMATHSSILAWNIPWMEEPGRLQSMGSQRVGHDWATSLHLSGASSSGFLHVEFPQCSPWGVTAVWWLLNGRCYSWVPSGLTIHGGCSCRWLWHPLFSDMAGNFPILTGMSVGNGKNKSAIWIFFNLEMWDKVLRWGRRKTQTGVEQENWRERMSVQNSG